MLVTTILTSFAQVFYKKASSKLSLDLVALITNYDLLIGISLYLIAAVLMITAFKGGEVSILYPIVATSYIWVSLLSVYFFNEIINVYKWVGVLAIFFGVALIGIGSKKDTIKNVEAI